MVKLGLLKTIGLLLLSTKAAALVARGRPADLIQPYEGDALQNIVTWDEHSLSVHGDRVLFYSGEFHPFRLPVPSLWLDVFQKIRALGYNGVSAYFDWALLEGNPGHFTAEGVFALEPFFEAASKAGIYILARPGPYINAEVSGGGFPGWLQRITGVLRTPGAYINATNNYVANIGQIIAKAQITNGGPVILLQPENEYTYSENGVKFPNPKYFNTVKRQYRDAGIVVPFINNDASPLGHDAPGTKAPVDIYGHDGYPLGFDCAHPDQWPDGNLPTNWRSLHEQQSPSTPYSIVEFQGGSFDPWGGLGFNQCADLLNSEFERVFYKNDYSFGVTIFNLYMTYGGTNWGNLGHPGGYTSYDYGAVIKEDRGVTREKYSQAKLQANFLAASSGYLTATPGDVYKIANDALTITPLATDGNDPYVQKFYVLRHSQYNSYDDTSYTLNFNTTNGTLTVPQLGGELSLNGRDSKIHVSDYQVGDFHLLYSTAEIFTWKADSKKTVLVVYGGANETHELAFTDLPKGHSVIPNGVKSHKGKKSVTINWETSPETRVVELPGNCFVYLLDRETAYDYWVLNVPSDSPKPTADALIVSGGYLLRSASISSGTLALRGDLNRTTTLEIIAGAPPKLSKLTLNGDELQFKQDSNGVVKTHIKYTSPKVSLPDLKTATWHYIDSLPEIRPSYSDEAWTPANHDTTNNTVRNITTPTSLYSSDYGYHTGTLIYRGHFTAAGSESSLEINVQGGSAFGFSAWLGSHFLGSYPGIDAASHADQKFTLPNLEAGKNYVFTIVTDNMGLDENFDVGSDEMKDPRGILNYDLSDQDASVITWKLTGNLHGENYVDKTRGPLNEGGMWAERQGYHQPSPPVTGWDAIPGGPITQGVTKAGIGFFVTSFDLDLPQGYDIPLSFQFTNATNKPVPNYRVQLFVNGWQFGKYVNNIGPQTSYPVPEGILNYHGKNWIALTLWGLDADGAKLDDLALVAGHPVQWGHKVEVVNSPAWKKRKGAY